VSVIPALVWGKVGQAGCGFGWCRAGVVLALLWCLVLAGAHSTVRPQQASESDAITLLETRTKECTSRASRRVANSWAQ
jgi:hypothetical protein